MNNVQEEEKEKAEEDKKKWGMNVVSVHYMIEQNIIMKQNAW